MRTETIKINLNQKLGDIMSFIPTDTIFNKKIPGLGATYLELICKRCSITIVPNKPVIKGKVKQFKELNIDILGVYHGIADDRIIKYITSTKPFKKIITTPESYILRIKPLMDLYKIDVINEYFMLYDESERTIQDNNYRETITAPMDDFFDFKERAMVTATPINPSDPRFKKHDFYHLEVKPLFDYTKDLNLLTTNNVLLSVREYLKKNDSKAFCFFLNSTDGILSLIEYLKIGNDTQVFCADKSVRKIRDKKLNAYTDLKPLKKYNFFTSSFFSAVDIELTFKPDVVILTDLFFAEHSIIDPATEAVQIVGRFRQGFNSLTHISNINPNIKFQTRDEIKRNLAGNKFAYDSLKMFHDGSIEPSHKSIFAEALKLVSYSKYVRSNGDTDWFKIDNKLDDDMVKSYYSSVETLKTAYSNVDHFNVTHAEEKYPLSDEHRLKRTHPKDDSELFKSVVEQLEILQQNRNSFTIDNSLELFNELNEEQPLICRLYNQLGHITIEKQEYKLSKAKKLLKKKLKAQNNFAFPAIQEILNSFNYRLLTDIPCSEFETVINRIKQKYNISQKVLPLLKGVYSVSERKQLSIKGQRVWCRQLSNPKFELPD